MRAGRDTNLDDRWAKGSPDIGFLHVSRIPQERCSPEHARTSEVRLEHLSERVVLELASVTACLTSRPAVFRPRRFRGCVAATLTRSARRMTSVAPCYGGCISRRSRLCSDCGGSSGLHPD